MKMQLTWVSAIKFQHHFFQLPQPHRLHNEDISLTLNPGGVKGQGLSQDTHASLSILSYQVDGYLSCCAGFFYISCSHGNLVAANWKEKDDAVDFI